MADGRANNKGNPQNFHRFDQMTPEERRAVQSKGGRTAARTIKAKKDLRQATLDVLEGKINYPLGDIEGFAQYDKKFMKSDGTARQITIAQRITLAMVKKAIHGDTAAAIYLRDTAGQKPIDRIQHDLRMNGFNLDWGNLVDLMEEESNDSEMEEGVEIDGE